MTDKPRDKKKCGGWIAALIVALVFLPTLYVASVGPAAALYGRGQISERTYMRLYSPVEWLATRNQTTATWTLKYMQWWNRHWPGQPVGAEP